jgi:cation transport ATPase
VVVVTAALLLIGALARLRWSGISRRSGVTVRGGYSLLRPAGGAERPSEHPLDGAVVADARSPELILAAPAGFESVTGRGIRASVAGRTAARPGSSASPTR